MCVNAYVNVCVYVRARDVCICDVCLYVRACAYVYDILTQVDIYVWLARSNKQACPSTVSTYMMPLTYESARACLCPSGCVSIGVLRVSSLASCGCPKP